MKIFTIKGVRELFIAVILLLLLFIATGQIAVSIITNDFKSSIVEHDYAIAGYLDRNLNYNLDKSQLTRAFTSEKTTGDITAGRDLLQQGAYNSSVLSIWIPEVSRFYIKYSFLVFLFTLLLSIAILTILLIYALSLVKKLDKASAAISCFMDGDHRIRLQDNEEGSIAGLFSSVNEMATSLTAHISREKQNKEFLRDTVSDISHQLKTPLAALKMYNEIIQGEKTGNSVVDSFIVKSGNELDRIESLIQSLLKLAELDADAVELDKRDCNLMEFLEQTMQSFRTRAQKEDKALALACDGNITLNCDMEWLLEAVSNIIKNALDHTGSHDSIEILGDETPVMIRITIKDTGKGIHPEDIHHIFKRFYRSRFSKDRQGVGIGLTLSRSIVEKHGGTILVESELDVGTSFQIVFPKLTNM